MHRSFALFGLASIFLASCGKLNSQNSSSILANEDLSQPGTDWKKSLEGKWEIKTYARDCAVLSALGINIVFRPGVYEFTQDSRMWVGNFAIIRYPERPSTGKISKEECNSLKPGMVRQFAQENNWLDPVVVDGKTYYITEVSPYAEEVDTVTYLDRAIALLHGTPCVTPFVQLGTPYSFKPSNCIVEKLFISKEDRKFDPKAKRFFAHLLSEDSNSMTFSGTASSAAEAVNGLRNDPNPTTVQRVK